MKQEMNTSIDDETQSQHVLTDESTSPEASDTEEGYSADDEGMGREINCLSENEKRPLHTRTDEETQIEKPRLHSIHPEIDPKATNVVSSSSFQPPQQHSMTPDVTLRQLPRLLTEYFDKSPSKKPRRTLPAVVCEAGELNHQSNGLTPKNLTKMIPGRCIRLEDTLSFTTCPRLLLEAEPPYTVVHANAAYAYWMSTSGNVNLDPPANKLDFVAAVRALFGVYETPLTVYPVVLQDSGSVVPIVTHYLVEASDTSLSTQDHIHHQPSEIHAQAIG